MPQVAVWFFRLSLNDKNDGDVCKFATNLADKKTREQYEAEAMQGLTCGVNSSGSLVFRCHQ